MIGVAFPDDGHDYLEPVPLTQVESDAAADALEDRETKWRERR